MRLYIKYIINRILMEGLKEQMNINRENEKKKKIEEKKVCMIKIVNIK